MIRPNGWKPAALLLLAALLCAVLASCGDKPEPEATPAPTVSAATAEPAAWPDDEAIAYCPPFTAQAPYKAEKSSNAQAKVYTMKYSGVTLEAYMDYVAVIEADEGIVVDTNTNLRDNAFSLNAHQAGDQYMMIHIVYTKATMELVISVTYDHPEVTA